MQEYGDGAAAAAAATRPYVQERRVPPFSSSFTVSFYRLHGADGEGRASNGRCSIGKRPRGPRFAQTAAISNDGRGRLPFGGC